MDVLAQNHITSKLFSAAISEQDLANMGFDVDPKDPPSSCNFPSSSKTPIIPCPLKLFLQRPLVFSPPFTHKSFLTSKQRFQSRHHPRTLTWPKPLLLLLPLLQTRALLRDVSHCRLQISTMAVTVNS